MATIASDILDANDPGDILFPPNCISTLAISPMMVGVKKIENLAGRDSKIKR